ncbi:hypothetical protein FC756_09475 [Lysinibacillus mangiferihumi]|uniref:Uncharacterized protein n=1 Tax=Lysinibacillus mangiferihumi TaxID=1130819 RepID=A0A4U2Z4Q8_9BACI|nr:hypothetical protein FC756_09475 [Lysinibacillus mangiferihumi]
MRKDEVLGLQWWDIDFEKQAINIIRNRTIHGTGTTKQKTVNQNQSW